MELAYFRKWKEQLTKEWAVTFLIKVNVRFPHANDPKHKAKETLSFFSENENKAPGISQPDFNPIKNWI